MVDLYENSKNKMILTGRSIILLKAVKYILFNILGFSEPNFGIYLFDNSSPSVKEFKLKIIEKTINENGWEKVCFYDDRVDWLDFVKENINKKYPSVDYQSINVK